MTKLDSVLKIRDIALSTKVKVMVFPVVMYGCESWAIKKAEHWRTDAFILLEKTLESPLDCKEIKPVNPRGTQPWIFIGRIVVEAEAPILWPPDAKRQLIGKDPNVGKDWGQEEKGDEIVGWHHWLSGHESEQILGDSEGQDAWCAAVHGVTKRHDLATEQQLFYYFKAGKMELISLS